MREGAIGVRERGVYI